MNNIFYNDPNICTALNAFSGALCLLELDCYGIFSNRYMNDAFCTLIGADRETIRANYGNDCFIGVCDSDRERVRQLYYANAYDGASFTASFRATGDGSRYMGTYASGKVRKIGDSFFYYICYDDSAIKERTERQLYAKELMYNLATEGTDINLWMYDIATKRATLTENCIRVHGIAESELLDFPNCVIEMGMVREDSIPVLIEMCDELQKGVQRISRDIWYTTPDSGGWVCERNTYTTIFDDSGVPVTAIGVGKNITDEIDFRAEKTILESALRNSNLLVWDYDITRSSISFRQSGPSLLKAPPFIVNAPESLIESGAIHPDSVTQFRALHDSVRKGAHSVSADIGLKRSDGGYNFFRVTYNSIFDCYDRPVRAIGCASDISAEREMEKKYNHELRMQNELVSDTTLVKLRVNLTKNIIEAASTRFGFESTSEGMSYDAALAALCETIDNPELQNEVRTKFDRLALISDYKFGASSCSLEYRRQSCDGFFAWVRTDMKLFENPDTGDLVCF